MEKILHFVTVRRDPSNYEMGIIDIAKVLHPDWQIMVWRDPIPSNEFLLEHYYNRAKSGAQLADLIRLDVVYKYGGIYLDSDVRLVKNLDYLSFYDNIFCSEDGINLTNAVFGATKGSQVIRSLIDNLLTEEPDWNKPPNITTGPKLFARVLHWRTDIHLLPRETFYPYNYDEPTRSPLVTTLGVHEWAGSWLPEAERENLHLRKAKAAQSSLKQRIKGLARRVLRRVIRASAPALNETLPRHGSAYTFGCDLIAKTNRGLLMSLPGSDLSITPEIALTGTYEEAELLFVEKTLRGGDFFIDVGCNVGVFSLVAARRVGPFGRVFAFDANNDVLVHLKRSLVMNWVHDRVKIFHCAVGDLEQMVTLKYSKLRLGDANLGLDAGSAFHRTVENLGDLVETEVRMLVLDHIFPHPLEIKIMKVDVEGYKYAVLDGAKRLTQQRAINYILLELLEEVASTQHRKNLDAVEFVLGQGYEIGRIDGEGNWLASQSIDDAMRYSRNIVLRRI